MSAYSALNGYKIMWLYVMFDLPTETKWQRKRAALFRKSLLKDGFVMAQFSVYVRHCASHDSLDIHTRIVKEAAPYEGTISILSVTDKQFERTIHIVGKRDKPPSFPQPAQLELF